MIRLLPVISILVILAGCGASTKGVQPSLLMDKEKVISNVYQTMPESCSYVGRVNVKFYDNSSSGSFGAIVNKKCSDDMDIRILGPFGMLMAELKVQGDNYKIYQGGKDVTASQNLPVSPQDLVLLRQYFSMPPPVPDDDYDMILNIDHYIFAKGKEFISVNRDYYVDSVLNGNHAVDYGWVNGALKSVKFARADKVLLLELVDPWKAK